MRKLLTLFLCLELVGCMTITLQDVTSVNRSRLLRLSTKMSKNEVLDIMGTDAKKATVVLHQYGNWAETPVENITINNPYKSEMLKGKDGKMFEILYYLTDVRKSDNNISDDELTPLVFENGELIGWGWNFLQDNVQKYELRLR